MKLNFDISPQEFSIVADILQNHLSNDCKVWVFGSRAKNQSQNYSDLDLAIDCPNTDTRQLITKLKDDFTESDLPYTVDVLDINRIEPYFKNIINQKKALFPFKAKPKVPQLRFPEFDQPLLTDILLNLTDILRCGIAATPKYVDSGITFLSSQNVTPTGKILMDKYNFISEDYYKKISKNAKLLKGDILYSRVGAGYGNAAIFPFEGDYGVYVSLTHIRASQKLDNTFLKFLLNSPIGKTQAKKGVFQGGGVPNLNVKTVEKFKINFPTKPEQQKIAAFLSAVDNKIEQLSKKQELLGSWKKGLMQLIFSQAIRFKADDGCEFPDWKDKKLSSQCVIKKGSQLNKEHLTDEGDYPALNGGINPSGYTTDWNTEASTITISEGGNSCGFVNFVATRFWSGGHNYSLQELKKCINVNYLYQYLKFNELQIMRLRVGSGLPNIQKGEISNFKVKLPALEEQTKIANFLSSIDGKIGQVGKQLDKSKQFKKALLQQMFV